MQVELSEYLQCELFHLLGAYGLAEERLGTLSETLAESARHGASGTEPSDASPRTGPDGLRELVDMSKDYNGKLKWRRYASRPEKESEKRGEGESAAGFPIREPLPSDLPLTNVERFEIGPTDQSITTGRESPWSNDEAWMLIPDFYGAVIMALESARRRKRHMLEESLGMFATSIIGPRDGADEVKGAARAARITRRLARYQQRHREAIEAIGGHEFGKVGHLQSAAGAAMSSEDGHPLLGKIYKGNLTDGYESLAMFVLRVHAEGHLAMHAVEAWRNLCLGGQGKFIQEPFGKWLNDELQRCIALSTFSFCAGRIVPWIFARDAEEREIVQGRPIETWENMIPVRCIWIATQVSLLSLHRRAYARALKDDPMGAYNDYHKLQYLIRDTERRVRAAPLHVDGALVFLAGLNAEAHHHIGELYRSQHAHRPALEHFRMASHGLGKLKEEPGGAKILLNSRWHVELQVSNGKACYEMGRHKEALYWHLSAWRSFLGLLSSETSTNANTSAIEDALAWLEEVKFEPEIRKSEIFERIGPVVEQLDRITMVGRLGALAAEILLRLGHLLFVLNIEPRKPSQGGSRRKGQGASLDLLCLLKAAECDSHSTLISADLLKAKLRGRSSGDKRLEGNLGSVAPIDRQWPGGGGDFEQLARAAEYLALRAQVANDEQGGAPEDRAIARALMLDLFMSTDSINVRKSQIHRFLMRERERGSFESDDAPGIELVCMRRYSSAFPLLPRPSAFRALGGGYFVRLDSGSGNTEKQGGPVGIVVDPGVDFVENLYRTGYSLSDIDMIVITHDHVDHLGGLDPLLSLLHVRSEILSKQVRVSEKEKRGGGEGAGEDVEEAGVVQVVTSRSVYERYESATVLTESPSLDFKCLEGRPKSNKRGRIKACGPKQAVTVKGVRHEFEVLCMSSAACNRDERRPGHRDLSRRCSFGVCIRLGLDGPSIAITSDTPEPSLKPAVRKSWRETWGSALDADVLVCHLGSVPLTELRRFDGYDPKRLRPGKKPPSPEWVREEEARLREIRTDLENARGQLRGQVEFAHWLRSHQPEGEPEVTAADLVGKVSTRWLPPRDHNYLRGLLSWAREFKDRAPEDDACDRLFVVGELSEELGTMRGKLATRLNDFVFAANGDPGPGEPGALRALTADIGLHAVVRDDDGAHKVEVLCTTCNLDTDRAREEQHHAASEIDEVCVKGENEGIFYNCQEHHPTARKEDEAFLERLERFDIFGR